MAGSREAKTRKGGTIRARQAAHPAAAHKRQDLGPGPAARPAGEVFLGGAVSTRPDCKGAFDELFATKCDLHIEMMDDNTFWMAIRVNGRRDEVHVTVSAQSKLKITAHEM